jgi:hypothetical protein
MIMTRIPPKRQRNVGFEALEGRLALSTGMAVASPHAGDAIERASERSIPASFTGRVSVSGSTLTTTNLKGHVGNYRLTGYGTGTVAGKQFEGGNVYLSNSQGNIQLALSPTYQVRAGKSLTRPFAITVVDATGAYAPFVTSTGTITRWNVPAKPNAIARFSALFTV